MFKIDLPLSRSNDFGAKVGVDPASAPRAVLITNTFVPMLPKTAYPPAAFWIAA